MPVIIKWKENADRRIKRKIEAMLEKASCDNVVGHPPSFPQIKHPEYCRNKGTCEYMEIRRTRKWRRSPAHDVLTHGKLYYVLCVGENIPCPKRTCYPVRIDLR